MSWIGGSLSSLTGQLTNLTKDILNEGTEEVIDPTAELQVAKEKLQQQDSLLTSLKHENDRLKRLNRELEEKAETSELQINAITSQYRALLEDKEKEINNLKHQHQELLGQHVRAELPAHHGDYEQQWSFNEHDFSSTNEESSGWDFDDSIKLQKENNRLQAELQHARSEVKHWRAAAKHLGQGAGQSEDHQAAGAEIVELQQKLKNLELQLASKTEELQQQATSLHEHHRQKVSALRSRHQEEVTALQEKLSALEHQIEANDGCSSSQYSGSGALAEADRVDDGGFHPSREAPLETDTTQKGRKSGQADQENGGAPLGSAQDEDFVLLSRRLQESELARRQVEKQLEQLKEELADAQGMLSDLRVLRECLNAEVSSLGEKFRSERQAAVNQLFRVVQQKNSLTQSLVQAKDEQEKLVEQTEACIEELGERNQQNFSLELFDSIEKENLTLKAETLKYVEQITLLEKKALACATDNQALLQKVQNLQARLREHGVSDDHWDTDDTLDMTFTSHSSGEHQGNSIPRIGSDEVDKELAQLRAELNSRSQDLANVEVERTDWMMEKDALEDVITGLRQKAQSLDQELRSVKSGASVNSSASDEAQDKIQTIKAEISSLQQENSELKNALEELDEQHAEAIEQVIQKRNQLAAQLSEKNAEIVQQQDTIDQLKKTITDLQESLSGTDKTNDSNSNHVVVWEEKCQQYESEMQDLSGRLSDALKANGAMEKEMADLRQKLHKGGQVINDLHMDKQELQEDLENARSETAAKVLKIKEMREDHKIILGEKKGLEAQLLDMKERLSELEDELDRWQQVNETNQVEKLSGEQKAEECAELRSKLAAFEEEKKLFSFNFEHILSDEGTQRVKEAHITDSAFQKILEKETNVRRQIESDGRLIHDLRGQVDKLYNDKQRLKEQLHENESLQASVTDRLRQLEGEHSKTLTELESCQQTVSELQQRLSQEVNNRQSLSQALSEANLKVEEAMKLNEQLPIIESEKVELSNQLESLMNYCEKLKNGQDSESILEENKKLLDTQRELTLKVEKLEAEVEEKISAEDVKSKDLKELELKFVTVQTEAASCVSKLNELQNICAEKDKEIEQMKSNFANLEEFEFQAELRVNEVSELKEEIKSLRVQQDQNIQWEKDLAASNETITRLQQELAAAQEMIQCQEAGIADLNEKSEENRRALEKSVFDLTKHKSTIAVLRQTSVDKQELLNELEAKLNFIIGVLSPEQIEILNNFTRRPALEYKEVKAIEYSNISPDSSPETETTALHSNSPPDEYIVEKIVETVDQEKYLELEKEIDRLQAELRDRDQKVAELQNNNATLLVLFEKGAGDRSSGSQIEMHRLENELRELRSEREQLMAVVTEKSREASSLKLETHRLVTALSASQAALGKLQEDNRDLHQRQSSHALDEEVDDMRKEALANMARLVRDKETELEAVKQKNETLLAVLHSSSESQAASHLAPLLKDKETLAQQIATLISEREQLIACVTQKHAEAVAYHAETQRLSGLLAEMQTAYEKASSDYQALIPKFDDKAQALVAAQNELVQCKQRLSTMEVRHGELIQRSNSMDLPRPDVSGLEMESLKQAEAALRLELCQRDEKVQSLGHRISTLEDELLSRDTECAHLKKQLENAKFQLTGLLSEIADLKTDRAQIQYKNIAQDSEFSSLRESCNKMTMEAKEKEGHISALKDQVATLTAVLHERQGEQGHISKLMKENHEAVALTQRLQHERDQLSMLVEQRRQECESLRSEASYYKDKEFKISREVERLRHHLIETEEGYTKEALEAEEREKDLRNKLAAAEEQAMLYHSKMEMASQDSVRQLESLQQQLQTVCGQRDSAYMQLANIQEQCQQYATSLSNLQLVLEHFQKEKEAAISAETDHLERECKTLRLELEDKKRELSDTKDDLIEALEGLEAANRLSEQLDRKEEAVAALKEEVLLRERALEAAEAEIHKLNSSSEAKVDKTLMHNMVMTWLTSPDNNRSEIVHLIGHVLSFSEDDFHKIEMAQAKKSYLSGIFTRTPAKDQTPVKSTPFNQSFSQLFVKFLEKESSPPTSPVRLPAEAMAAEAQHRHKSPFNPFTAPRHATHDPQKSSSPSTHLLISNDVAPMASALFAPISNSHASSESAILKDVLGKR